MNRVKHNISKKDFTKIEKQSLRDLNNYIDQQLTELIKLCNVDSLLHSKNYLIKK